MPRYLASYSSVFSTSDQVDWSFSPFGDPRSSFSGRFWDLRSPNSFHDLRASGVSGKVFSHAQADFLFRDPKDFSANHFRLSVQTSVGGRSRTPAISRINCEMEQTSSHKRVSSRIFSSSCGNQSSRKGSRKERATDGRVGQIQYKARPPPPGVKPIKIYSERDLAAEMQKINETLECVKDVSWKARLTALDRLGGLVLGGAHELINFTPLFKRMKESLIKQLQSLRSKVVKHACKVLAYISSTLRNQFENLMEFLIPALANLNNSSKQ
eukprot:632733-Amorphochlora_amoeboformis.AAC.1